MFGNSKLEQKVDRLMQDIAGLRDDLSELNRRVAHVEKAASAPRPSAPLAVPVPAKLDTSALPGDAASAVAHLESRIQALDVKMMTRLTEVVEATSKRVEGIEATGSAGGNHVEHLLKLTYESAALSQFLLMLGDYLTINKIIPAGATRRIYDALVDSMEPDMRQYGARVISNLEYWRQTKA